MRAARSLDLADDAFSVARALAERDEPESALDIAEHGLKIAGPKLRLARWLADYALEVGDRERARAAAEVAFFEAPSLSSYRKVRELSPEALARVYRVNELGVERVSAHDNFFDVGGHSLLLIRVHSRLRESLHIDYSIIDLDPVSKATFEQSFTSAHPSGAIIQAVSTA